ncbi:8-amino-7-oxononanoate synthase 2 [Posidoniimonas polymericola]|uniref:8-amino-7-oxononanoate synthase n=1 Tax=Posidoniimonas polymericola TaxID=2528002 RepID=A0A5C5XYR1_9BACT|nr:aminotransferase class I/II-fold pyridoxal phosphate-dependent enzyme [Posidoniimonas polymericola]TWT67681.1 8-amino-7-oxononanoate synthase 2 [Posidoniimonas polymericola]
MNEILATRIASALSSRSNEGLLRRVQMHAPQAGLVNLADNDYWSLSKHPEVQAAAREAIERYGCSACASPLITGFGPAHELLLARLKQWHDFAHGLVWNSGFAANRAVLSQLPRRGDLVLADRLIHKSMVHGILDSGARLTRYRHCDLDHLASLLAERPPTDGVTFVVTESVFSMDGDYPDVGRMAELKRAHDFVWLVDEAHAIGWYGERGSGLVEEAGVADQVDVLVGTLGKALGSMGAYTLLRDERLEQFLENYASEFIYSTYLAPACAAAALRATEVIEARLTERQAARDASRRFRAELRAKGWDAPDGDSPIVPIILGNIDQAERARDRLRAVGVLAALIRPPTVPPGTARVRLSLKGDMAPEVLTRVAAALGEPEDAS